MQIVPVLDVKSGLVVRGVMGDRANYRPIETPLAPSAEPQAVLAGLMALAPFQTVYIADLDVIEAGEASAHGQSSSGVRRRGEADRALLGALAKAHPSVEFWLDAGVTGEEDALTIAALPQVRSIVGSESIDSAETVRRLGRRGDVALSLDFRGADFIGPPAIFEDASLWPDRLIVMTLQKVGSGAGPDFDLLRAIKARAGDRWVYAAGGVRGPQDLRALDAMGMAGVLVASALHDGRITRADLDALAG
ncbi:nickel transporter [Jiella sp. MQZ9-1]|uniref:Nickel transporter n=1 Tax=Jiella flava TaxID=2816857 RepID=A0A939G2K6_9HYPH|nr:HisA/HisF-related TIM barrel protein [Jiella flava]MBO0663914.1 nickel transporter [Jiella flava]MCD2472486.1 nickel transporter [Jiella flava]